MKIDRSFRYDGFENTHSPKVYPENSFSEIEQFCRFRGLDLAQYAEINEGDGIWDFLADRLRSGAGALHRAKCRGRRADT